MKIESIDIEQLVFDPNNARKHSEKNLNAIKGSLTKFGQQKPVVIDAKNIIVAGNGTVAAAKELGWKKISVVRTKLDGFMQSAFALADNRTSELAEWDDDILKESLAQLELNDFDIGDIGFDDINLDVAGETITLANNKELSEESFSKFDHTCPRCVCGMSVPPFMMQRIANQIYLQLLNAD